jgi:hypothetical protein
MRHWEKAVLLQKGALKEDIERCLQERRYK